MEAGGDGPRAFASESEYHVLADRTMEGICEQLEDVDDRLAIEDFDCNYSQGVMTLVLGNLGTFVVNKQTPNRQIWYSSPVSGPRRYDYITSRGQWEYSRAPEESLHAFLSNEVAQVLGVDKAEVTLIFDRTCE